MQIRLIRNVTALGKAGTVRSVDAPSGRALVVLGMAVAYVEPPPAPEAKKVRTYKRKDIVPEPVIEVEEPQPMPEPEIEPEPEPEPEAEDTDEEYAPVRLRD
jgi:hypothetical protein